MRDSANEELNSKAEEIARDIMTLSKNSLLVHFRYLDRALAHLKLESDGLITFETDGETLFYRPWYVLSQYRAERNAVTRNLLHSLLHCVFCHSFIGKRVDHLRWDLACDIAVEHAISELKSPILECAREYEQEKTISLIEADVPTLTAERIYRYLMDGKFSDEDIERERECFKGDSHSLWYGDTDPDAKIDEKVQLKKVWEEVSKRMQTELEIQHNQDGAMVQNLKSLNRDKRSYTDFLKRFAVTGEVLKTSDEEFDQNYYLYGLELLGNVPLIESLEYSEQKRIREFIIAIDTSGSVRGEIVQNFIQHTYDILKRTENFFTKVNIYIVQCDDRIQDVAHITCPEDFEQYITTMEIKGLGKTDFRPVFEFAEEKIRTKELTDLRGLIYFTDGYGRFPDKPPSFDTAFVLHRRDYDSPEVPNWAMHMSIAEESILDKDFSTT